MAKRRKTTTAKKPAKKSASRRIAASKRARSRPAANLHRAELDRAFAALLEANPQAFGEDGRFEASVNADGTVGLEVAGVPDGEHPFSTGKATVQGGRIVRAHTVW